MEIIKYDHEFALKVIWVNIKIFLNTKWQTITDLSKTSFKKLFLITFGLHEEFYLLRYNAV
jgi:hypothetical protein